MTEYKVSKTNLQRGIHGLVRHQGLPMAGIQIRLYSQQESENMSGQSPADAPVAIVQSGKKGDYEFNVAYGTYSIQAIPSGDSRLLKQSLFNINLDKSGINRDISLVPGMLLRGKVSTASGDTVRDGEVFALGIEPTPYWCTSSIDKKGNYTLVLPKGKFHIGSRCSASGLFGSEGIAQNHGGIGNGNEVSSRDNFFYLSKQIHSVDVYRDQTFDLELPEMVRFRGELVDPMANPVSGARVCLTPKDVEESPALSEVAFTASCLTDSSGRFEIHLEQGVFDLDVVPQKDSKQFGFSEADIRINANQDRKFTLEEGHKLSGRVIYKDQPLPNCLVRIHGQESDREFIAESNDDGEFAASIPPGVYNILVSAENKKSKLAESDDQKVVNEMAPWTKEIVVGGDTHVAIKLQSGINLSGCIKDDAGRPKSGIRVSVFSQNNSNKEGLNEETLGRSMVQTNTDKDGRFSFSLVKGKYWLAVHRDFESARKVEIDSDPQEVEISWHGWCQVAFCVEGEDEARIPRCKVMYEPYKASENAPSNNKSGEAIEHPSGYVITDRDGICKLTIPSGIYTFRFSPPLAGSYASKEIRQLSIISDSKRKVSLPRKN